MAHIFIATRYIRCFLFDTRNMPEKKCPEKLIQTHRPKNYTATLLYLISKLGQPARNNFSLCWQLQVNTKLTLFSLVLVWLLFFFLVKKTDKVKLSLLLSEPLEIAAVLWAGFTTILLLLELLLETCSTQRESNLPSIYILHAQGG